MIFETILMLFLGIIKAVMSLIPSIPQMPDVIVNSIDTLFTFIISAVSFSAYIFSPPLLVFLFTATIVILTWDAISNMVMFVLRKIPFLAIE